MSPFNTALYDLLLKFRSNHRPISYRFRDRRRFVSKIANYSHPRVFRDPAEGVPLGTGYRCWGQKTRMMGLRGRQEVLRYFQPSGSNPPTRDRRTDGHWATAKTALTHSVAR